MPNSTERLSLILDARVADFEQGLKRAESSLGRLATQAQKSGGDFQKSVDQSINAAQKSLDRLGRTRGAEDLRDLFSRAKQAAASFQKDFERIQRDIVRVQDGANKALIKSQQDLVVAQRQAEQDITRIKKTGANNRKAILDGETAREAAAKKKIVQIQQDFAQQEKRILAERDAAIKASRTKEEEFRKQASTPNKAEQRRIEAQERDRRLRIASLEKERQLLGLRQVAQKQAALAPANSPARANALAEERSVTQAIQQEREYRLTLVRKINNREIKIKEEAAARAASVDQRAAKFGLAQNQADADARIRIAQAAAAREKAIAEQRAVINTEAEKRGQQAKKTSAATEESIQKRLEQLERRRQQIIKANIGALDAAKGAEDKYQGELTETANKIRELTAALEALKQRRADAARAGLDRIGAPPPGGGRGGRAGGGGAGGGLGGGPSPAGAAGALRDLNSSVNRLRIGILNIQTALGLVGASFGIKESLDLASQFERELASINTLLVNAQVPIERYRDQLVQLSVESSKDLIDLTQGLYQTVSAGIPAIEGAAGAFELLVQAQKAAVAGNATTRQSVNALITTVKAYEATGITAAEASDKLFTTVRLGRTTFEELSSTIGRILGITANFGLSLDESLAAVATITRVIPSTAESITQLRALIRGIVRPAKQVSSLLADINERTGAQLEFSAKALREQGLSGIIEQILEVTGGDPDILARLFPNVRALGGAAVLTASTFRDFIDAIDQLGNSANATDIALSKVENTLQEQSKILRSRFQKVLIEIGEKSFPLIKDALVDIGNFLEDNQDTFQVFFAGILVSARDLFTFLKENFDSIVRAVEAFLLVRFPAAFAAFKGLIAPEGEGLGAIANALLLGLSGSFLLKSIGAAAAKLGAAFVAKFTPVVATGVAGAIRAGVVSAAGGLVTAILTAVGTAAVVGVGLLVNRSFETAKQRLQDVADGNAGGSVGDTPFLSQEDRERASAAGKEKARVKALTEIYEQAAKAAREAGLAVSDFYELLDKNRGDLDKTVEQVKKSLEGAQALAISGDILQIEPGAFNRVFRGISEEAKKTQEDVIALEEALVELKTGASLGERAKALAASAEIGLGPETVLNKPRTKLDVRDKKKAVTDAAIALAEAELSARREVLESFNEDDLRAQVRQQELIVDAYKAQLVKARADLAIATDDATKQALEGTIAQLTGRLQKDLEPALKELADRLPDAIGAGDIINRSEFEQGIFDAVKKAANAGELSLARVVRNAPRLSAASTFGQLLKDQSAAQAESIQFLAEKAKSFQEELDTNQQRLDAGGLTDRQSEELRDNIRKIQADLDSSNSLLARINQGIATPAEIAATNFAAFGEELGLSVDAARELADQIGGAFSEGRYADGLKALQTANGEITDIAGALRLWALRQKEINESTTGYEGIVARLTEAQNEQARLQKEVADSEAARAQAALAGSDILVRRFKALRDLSIERLDVQSKLVKQLEQQRDSSLQLFKNTEALIDRLFAFLLRQQASLNVNKANKAAFDAAKAIAAFDRQQEIIRRQRQLEDLQFETLRLKLEGQREAILGRIQDLERSISVDAFKGIQNKVDQLHALREAAIGSEEGLKGLAAGISAVEQRLLDVEQGRAEEDADLAIERLQKQRQEIFARATAAKANALAKKAGSNTGKAYVDAASKAIASQPPVNLIPKAFEDAIILLESQITEARRERDNERLRGLLRQYKKTLVDLNEELNKIVQNADSKTAALISESVELVGSVFVQAAENTLEAVKQTLSGLEQISQGYKELQTLADSDDPLLRSLLPASAVDRSQLLLELRRSELAVLEAQKRVALEESAVRDANTEKALMALEADQLRLDLEEDRLKSRRGEARSLDLIDKERELLKERETSLLQQQAASSQQLLAEQRKLELARQRLIIETSILPTAAISRAADKLAGSFFERLKQLLPSIFVTGAQTLFNKINEGIVALEDTLGFELPDFLDSPQGTKVLVSDRFGTTLKDIVDAIRAGRPGPNITGGAAGSAGSTGSTASRRTPRSTRVPGSASLFVQGALAPEQQNAADSGTSNQQEDARVENVFQSFLDALALSVRTNVNTGIPAVDPNANVPGPAFRPVVASYIGPVLTAYTQAIELVTDQLIRGAEIFSSKVVEPLLNVSLVGIDKLLDGLGDALGVLTDIGQEFTGQVIRRPPQGSDVVAIRREAAAQRFAEQRARAAGLVQRASGEGSATGRAMRALEKAAKDALKLTERIIEGLPTVIDKFLDLLIERGPELLEKAGDALVIVVRKLLQRLPEIVRALAPVLADIVINLVEEIINQLPQIIEAFAALLNTLLIKSGELFGRVITSLVRNFDEIIKGIVRAFPQILSGLIVGVAAGVAEALVSILKGLIPGSDGFSGTLFGAGLGAVVGSVIPGVGTLVGAGVGGLIGSFFHDGGEVKAGQRNRSGARAMLAAGAGRYRTGGVVLPSVSDYLSQQLRGDEVPAVLQVGERVLSRRQVSTLGGQSGIDDLLANRGQQDMSVESNVVLSYDKSNDPLTDALMNALLPRLQVRGTTNVNQNPRTVGTRPARGRGV